jgi:hypothetical protein
MQWAWLIPWVPWIGGLLSFGCMLAAFRNYRRKRLSEALPTSRALGVFMGLVEMKGAAECEQPLTSRIADALCVHYEWSVEEHWEREEYVTRTDSDGKTTRERETQSGWTNVGQGKASVPFYVKDATGAILVQPQGAEMDPPVVLNRSCSPDDDLYYGKGPPSDIANSTHRRRFVEKAIRLHAPVYIVGKARERKDVVAAEIAADGNAPLFLISGRTEQEVQSSFFWRAMGWTVLGLVLLVAGLVIGDVLLERDLHARRPFYFQCAGAYLVVWMFAWVWNVFNDVIGLRNRVREGWSLIDIQLKRRHDLIPNLVRIVAALRDHERNVHEQLAALRAQTTATMPGQPGPDHMALKPALIAVQEKYPVLKVMSAFQALQRDLVDTEERVALARDYYNNIATHFNTRIEQIPDRVVCILTVMRRFEPLSARDFERAAIKVEFAK